MKKYLFNLKYIVLGSMIALTSCISDDLPGVGDLEDFTSPTPFYSYTDVSSSEFNCNKVEQWVNYDFNFQAGSNLAVNGTKYQWTVTPSDNVKIVNKDLPILEKLIEVEKATIVSLEGQIAKLQFKLPCENNPAKVVVLNNQIADLQTQLQAAKDALTDEEKQNIADLEAKITALPAGTLEDRELIFSFPSPGNYTVSLTVTDNLGKFESTEKSITVIQAVPVIPIPEIVDAGFEDGNLFLDKKDGSAGWRVPGQSDGLQPVGDRSLWHPTGQNSYAAPQITVKDYVPEGTQAAKLPSDGSRVLYQEIEVTPGAKYVLTYFTDFNDDAFADFTLSIFSGNSGSLTEAKSSANTIATRTDTNVGRTSTIFKKHAISFEAGTNETVIIYGLNSGAETRVDAFDIVVKQ